MRVLVTGGCGFLGSHVCEHFKKKGWDVISYDNMTKYELKRTGYGTDATRDYNWNYLKSLGVTMVKGDIRNLEHLLDRTQDCDFLINYDIHWNPVRIIQRFGRVDRIGSKNDYIKLVNFWPQIELEEYIKLKYRVENKMTLVEITGEEKENAEQELRKLQKLKNNILDIEDIETGITLTDISLNDFRIDLSTYIQNNPKVNFDEVPSGIHTSVNTGNEGISGVVYLLKLLKISKKPFNENIHPYYLIFIGRDNEVIMTHINVKKILDLIRLSTRGKKVPDEKGVNQFNSATNFGDNMTSFSKQLTEAIKSIVAVNSDSEIESIFERGGTRINSKDMKELSDFELVSFFNLYD